MLKKLKSGEDGDDAGHDDDAGHSDDAGHDDVSLQRVKLAKLTVVAAGTPSPQSPVKG